MIKLKPKVREAHGVHYTLFRTPCPTPELPHRSEQQAVQTGVLVADLTRAVFPSEDGAEEHATFSSLSLRMSPGQTH